LSLLEVGEWLFVRANSKANGIFRIASFRKVRRKEMDWIRYYKI
jgi:hypothetical protein